MSSCCSVLEYIEIEIEIETEIEKFTGRYSSDCKFLFSLSDRHYHATQYL